MLDNQTEVKNEADEAVACCFLPDGPLDKDRRRELRRQLKHESDCEDVIAALQFLVVQAILFAEKHRRISLWWGRAHYFLGLPAAALANVAGVTGFNQDFPRAWMASLALVAAILTAAVGFLRCENSRDRNNALCAGWTHLADEVRYALIRYKKDKDRTTAYRDLRRLSKSKMELLWGVLRSGPVQPNEVLLKEPEPVLNGSVTAHRQ
jgi:hypothetical protein